jgi:hypothetical protein
MTPVRAHRIGLTLVIVGGITLGLTAETMRLRIGVPAPDSAQIVDLARLVCGGSARDRVAVVGRVVLYLAAFAR